MATATAAAAAQETAHRFAKDQLKAFIERHGTLPCDVRRR